MKHLLELYLFALRAPDDGAGGGDGGNAGGAGGDQGGAGSGDAGGGAGDAVGAGGGAADGGEAGTGSGDAAQLYRPEGLPDTMFGKDNNETIDKMHDALKGYRQRDSAVGENADAYKAFEFDKMDATLKPHMEGLANDPIMDAAAKYALENKMPVPQVQGLIQTVYGEAAKHGVFEGFIDVAAERQALLPEAAKGVPAEQQEAAIEARLKANEDWVKLVTKSDRNPDGMPEDVAENGLLMLMDTAKGNQFIEFVRHKITGGDSSQPMGGDGGGGGGGNDPRAALQERLASPEMQPDHPKFDAAAYTQLMEDYRKQIGE